MTERMTTALNEQINEEMFSSYLYLSMSAYFEDLNLNGFANWMRVQAQEELAHAMKFFDYINERGARINLKNIKEPKMEWAAPLQVAEETLEHEKHITSKINDLINIAIEEKDHATNNFLQWFIAEQVEEESSADEILQQVKMTEGKGAGLFMIDKDLKTRIFVPPAE